MPDKPAEESHQEDVDNLPVPVMDNNAGVHRHHDKQPDDTIKEPRALLGDPGEDMSERLHHLEEIPPDEMVIDRYDSDEEKKNQVDQGAFPNRIHCLAPLTDTGNNLGMVCLGCADRL